MLPLITQRNCMNLRAGLLFFCVSYSVTLFSQSPDTLPAPVLDTVILRAFEQNTRPGNSAIQVTRLRLADVEAGSNSSLLPVLNQVPGVRMEERSPASYRLNIRGSSLRSPFGVRNVKVYWNAIPVTDPGGNTYFNQFAGNSFSSLELVKGPSGSMYGAGTGGLILLHTDPVKEPAYSLDYSAGAWGLQQLMTGWHTGRSNIQQHITVAHTQQEGYREQSAMRRDNLSWAGSFSLTDKSVVEAGIVLTDLWYQTPGALTVNEYQADPAAARPAAGSFPSAVAAKAAIFQQTALAGLTHRYRFSSVIQQQLTLFGNYGSIRNAAIRNYEKRKEPSGGLRYVLTATPKKGSLRAVAGTEIQQGHFTNRVFTNQNGQPITLQTNDAIVYSNILFFAQAGWRIGPGWIFSSGISINSSHVRITRHSSPLPEPLTRRFRNELSPRLSVKRKITDRSSISATLSRGYSPPTLAEILPSTGVISTGLEAEYGWNTELTGQTILAGKRLELSLTLYNFRLLRALVQRRDTAGADYFVNAGDVNQRGAELQVVYNSRDAGRLRLEADYTFTHYRYGLFRKGNDDFSGNTVPSVPAHTLYLQAGFRPGSGWNLVWTTLINSRIWLNDANTARAAAFTVMGIKAEKDICRTKNRLRVFAGLDNITGARYSLGNDINAAAGRYYNAAAGRSYYGGFSFRLVKSPKQAR